MLQQLKVYISAKLEHASKLAALAHDGFHFNARWMEMADAGRKRMKPVTHWQQENFDDIDMAHFIILYVEPADHLKGSLVEIGYAIRAAKKIWICGNQSEKKEDNWGVLVKPDGAENEIRVPHKDVEPWGYYRQQVKFMPSIEAALLDMKAITRHNTFRNADGSDRAMAEF